MLEELGTTSQFAYNRVFDMLVSNQGGENIPGFDKLLINDIARRVARRELSDKPIRENLTSVFLLIGFLEAIPLEYGYSNANYEVQLGMLEPEKERDLSLMVYQLWNLATNNLNVDMGFTDALKGGHEGLIRMVNHLREQIGRGYTLGDFENGIEAGRSALLQARNSQTM